MCGYEVCEEVCGKAPGVWIGAQGVAPRRDAIRDDGDLEMEAAGERSERRRLGRDQGGGWGEAAGGCCMVLLHGAAAWCCCMVLLYAE
eukprot:347512-Chlamydomonas_euryale.AAC.1